jgi:peptidoglycan/LPS O-acetylase OafA/YrhL
MTHPSAAGIQNKQHLAFVDGLRAVAVLSVIACHASFVATIPPWIARLVQPGRHGVELFFVISGFCLAMPYLRNYQATISSSFNGPKFYASRIFRILPPYYIAVILLALLAQRLTLPNIIAHAFFAQDNPRLLNGSFWTLRIEAIWYLLFPFCLWLFINNRKLFFSLACLSAAIAILFHEPPVLWRETPGEVINNGGAAELLLTFSRLANALPAFLLGILAADMHLHNKFSHRILWSAFILSGGLALAGEIEQSSWVRLAWSLVAFSFVVLANSDERVTRLLSNRVLVAIGVASYSIYLVHLPVILVLEYVFRVAPVLAAGCSLFVGFAFWRIVERPLMKDGIRQPATNRIRLVIEGGFPKLTLARDKLKLSD